MHKEKNNNYNHYGPDLQLCKLEPLSVDANVTSYSSYVLGYCFYEWHRKNKTFVNSKEFEHFLLNINIILPDKWTIFWYRDI